MIGNKVIRAYNIQNYEYNMVLIELTVKVVNNDHFQLPKTNAKNKILVTYQKLQEL